MDLGGCVEGVSMSLVRAMSSGANKMPAMLAADTATASEARGAGDDRMSRPPAEPDGGLIWNERPGSGMAKTVAKKERAKEVRVERKTVWM